MMTGGFRQCLLRLDVRKSQCLDCGRSFRQQIPGVQPFQRASESFQEMVSQQHLDGIYLGDTLHARSEEIARMWRFTRSNAITEGFHNKMAASSRQAYGFGNFENYQLCVKVLCG